MKELDESDLRCSAIVFSPHPDDETLGCGGTIIKKKRLGADVTIVFMTDGGRSHPHLISEDLLKPIRKKEALAASRVLGVEEKDVIFLEVRDGTLAQNRESTISKVVDILLDRKPEEIFVPYSKEPPSWASEDHLATNRIVVSALRIVARKIVVNECPLAFWLSVPWSNVNGNTLLQNFSALKNGISSNLNALNDFRSFVSIKDILATKRDALDQHKSQMTRLLPNPRWQTMVELSNGRFLDCFFQDREIFYRYLYQ